MAIVLAVLAIGFSPVSAQAAPGLEPGVHADPGSPAAKEYALPLDQARQTGSPGKAASSAPAFGAGIHPRGGSGRGSSVGHSASRGTVRDGAADVTVAKSSGSRTSQIVPAAVLRASGERGSSGSDGSILALIGGGVAILVLGGFGGVVMRRSNRAGSLG